jgi:hypothetical protein
MVTGGGGGAGKMRDRGALSGRHPHRRGAVEAAESRLAGSEQIVVA